MTIRAEVPADHAAVRAVNEAAFLTATEADLVDALRAQATPLISLVAERDGAVVGHIMFSPVTLDGFGGGLLLGLAPMAVRPGDQQLGIGSALVRAGLDACSTREAVAVIVLGHPTYYPRFGFVPASGFGLRSAYDVPDEVFMAQELVPGALAQAAGVVQYHPVFAMVT